MTSISKNMYIGKLDDIVDEYNNNIIKELGGNLLMLRMIHILILKKMLMTKIQNLKLVIT